jgi:hypothetical protein
VHTTSNYIHVLRKITKPSVVIQYPVRDLEPTITEYKTGLLPILNIYWFKRNKMEMLSHSAGFAPKICTAAHNEEAKM